MPGAKELILRPIPRRKADRLIQLLHYSRKVVNNSQISLGVFLGDVCGGVLQFGPSTDKSKIVGLVEDTGWNEFIELNRMALADWLPRNSESRCLAVAMRLLRRHYQHLKWVITFADGTQCGDGTIYRAAGFILTQVKKNEALLRLPDGSITHKIGQKTGRDRLKHYAATRGASRNIGEPLQGFQLRYLYFLDPACRDRLTVPELDYSRIDELGAGMYRGKPRAPLV